MSVKRRESGEEAFWEQAFSRNRFLISSEVQQKLREYRIAVAGLSVGSSAVRLLVETGAGNLTIADGDELAIHNLNRIWSKASDVGENKATVLARDMLETNPYLDLEVYPKYVGSQTDEKNVSYGEFLEGADIVIDAVDSFPAKLGLRLAAKRKGIPLLMGTDLGFSSKLDFEDGTIFHGRLTEKELEKLSDPNLDHQTKTELAIKIVGPEFIPPSFLAALQQASFFWPQLGMTAQLSAVLTVRAVLEILEGEKPEAEVSIDLEKLI